MKVLSTIIGAIALVGANAETENQKFSDIWGEGWVCATTDKTDAAACASKITGKTCADAKKVAECYDGDCCDASGEALVTAAIKDAKQVDDKGVQCTNQCTPCPLTTGILNCQKSVISGQGGTCTAAAAYAACHDGVCCPSFKKAIADFVDVYKDKDGKACTNTCVGAATNVSVGFAAVALSAISSMFV